MALPDTTSTTTAASVTSQPTTSMPITVACATGTASSAAIAAAVVDSVSVDADDVGVWVVDLEDGCGYGVNADTPMVAASTIKLLALAGVLELAQSEDRDLTPYERALVEPMIQYSDNDAASELIDYLEATDQDFSALGASWGVPGAQNPTRGLSEVTARDMAGLVVAMFDGSRLSSAYQDLAKTYLDLPDDDFATGWRVAVGYDLPSGWYEGSKVGLLYQAPDGVNVHGVGLIEGPDGHRYAVAVLARGWATYDDAEVAYQELDAVGAVISCLVSSDVSAGQPETCAS